MTFEKQVKKAQEEKLLSRIRRDVLFIILGLLFLAISIFNSIRKENTNENFEESTTSTTIKK